MTNRERKIEFINSFGQKGFSEAVRDAFCRRGPDWLTDEQLADIAGDVAKRWRFAQRINRQNRELSASARRGRDEAAA